MPQTDTKTQRATSNACRHYLGLFPDNRPVCKRGWDVRKWAVKCNGGSDLGIGLRLPCTKQSGEKPLFDCPSVDRKTDEEIAEQRKAMSARMDRIVTALPKLNELKQELIRQGKSAGKFDCPFCGEAAAMNISVALGVNNHMRAQCGACGEGLIE
jgi:predicted RNA-binding Zn-ribbon protein involved in translation (DUF1610 family)